MILSIILAALLPLAPGYNNTGAAGEVVAASAATSNATATVAIKSVNTLTTYTNTTAQVVTYEDAWRVVYTNFDGNASIEAKIDAFNGHLILLEEAMIYGRAGDMQRAEEAFNQYYDSKAQEYRGHEGWKSYGYLRAHLNYLAELADKLRLKISNPI